MPFDALTISAVRDELLDKLVEGRVQNVIMPSPLSVSLEIYRAGVGRTHLLLSAHPQHARVHFVGSAPSRDPAQHSPLLLLLRKYVRGGTILNVSQPRWERVLTLSIAKRISPHKHQEYRSEWDFRHTQGSQDQEEDEIEDISAPLVKVELVAEIMGKVSNIILVAEDGTVIESVKRVPSSINRYRVTLPHHPYVAPPPQAKRDPLHTSINMMAMEIQRATEASNAPAWKGLVGGYAAISPTLAREVVYRALGDVGAKAAEVWNQPHKLEALLREMQELLRLEETGKWEPAVAMQGEGEEESHAVDFAPYRLTHLAAQDAELVEYGSISEAAEAFYQQAGSQGRHTALKAIVAARLAEIKGRDERKLWALRDEWERAQAMEALRRKGELLLAYMHMLKPGETTLTIPEEKVTIQLDPSLTPVENAQAIFREYRKAQSAIEGLPERMAESETRVAYLNELGTSLEIATSYDDIKSVQGEVEGAGRPQVQQEQQGSGRKKQKPVKLPQPLRMQTTRGMSILLGRTAGQNDTATFRLASPEDLWFHARNTPGAHVILRAAPQVSEEDIEEAARLAAGYSKLRSDAQVDVIYTEKRYVRKIPNAPPGQVTYRNEKVIRVAPERVGGK
jgi:predicted ribosome quality control (RQC) complex YloA/Tae2 family protein